MKQKKRIANLYETLKKSRVVIYPDRTGLDENSLIFDIFEESLKENKYVKMY